MRSQQRYEMWLRERLQPQGHATHTQSPWSICARILMQVVDTGQKSQHAVQCGAIQTRARLNLGLRKSGLLMAGYQFKQEECAFEALNPR